MRNEIKIEITNALRKVSKKERLCLFGNCNSIAINSHVLQKNGILREMSVDNHLIQLERTNGFEFEEKGIMKISKIGINKAFAFKGFCKEHDLNVFKHIENGVNLSLYEPKTQALFCYRGLCQEIRRKEEVIEQLNEISKINLMNNNEEISILRDGMLEGMKNLIYHKETFETAFLKEDYNDFTFNTIKIDRINICFSVPLNIQPLPKNGENESFFEWKSRQPNPFKTSFLNLFPYKSNSYFISGFHNDFRCEWTLNKMNKLGKVKKKVVLKEISDFLVLRLEFWAMSPKLYNTIPKHTIIKFMKTFEDHIYDHDPKLRTKVNLFNTYG